jgi:hypothetical protein
VRLTTSHRKTLLLRNLNRGGQGPIWAVARLNGWILRNVTKELHLLLIGTATKHMDRVVKAATEIRLCPDNFNADEGFTVSHTRGGRNTAAETSLLLAGQYDGKWSGELHTRRIVSQHNKPVIVRISPVATPNVPFPIAAKPFVCRNGLT